MRVKLRKYSVFFRFILFTGIMIFGYGYSQNVMINEVMSSNIWTIADEDGEFPDWIEIYNAGQSPFTMTGFFLSDDTTDIFKWKVPDVIFEPQAFILIYASGKNRKIWANYWETIINWGDVWKYRLGTSEPQSHWNQVVFDDSQWQSGPSGFGYGDGDDATLIPQTISLYVRKNFTISDLDNITSAQLHIDYDDAFVAYLNAVEIARRNIGEPGTPPAYNQPGGDHEAEIYQGGVPEVIHIEDVRSILKDGTNVLAIQVHNQDYNSSDFSLIPFFSLGLVNRPAKPRGMPDLLRYSIPRLHTNFKISSDGEILSLSDSMGEIYDQINTGYMPADVSRGRQPDGSTDWYYFDVATPGSNNSTGGYVGTVPDPQFSLPGGNYNGTVGVSLFNGLPASEIRYTLDGAEPTNASPIFSADLTIHQTTVVRARAFFSDMIPSRIMTHTYIIDATYKLPVISLSTTPANLWNDDIGVYAGGNNAEDEMPYYGANFWQDWERPIHIELYEPDGRLGFSIDAGVKIHGAWARGFPQKSLAIFARGRYGYSEINYQIFPDKPIYEFQSIILRNAGNDWKETMFRDPLMTRIVKEVDIDIQAYRPAIVYINGAFWGIYNIREKINEHYLASNHGVDPANVDLLELDGGIIEGDADHYERLMDFLRTQDVSDPANYEYLQSQMNMDNYISYQVIEIYYDNLDWPWNNLKYWRPRTQNGKWRWILFDTDDGFAANDRNRYIENSLEFATEEFEQQNPEWSTFMLKKLLENQTFKNTFINRFADFMNVYFQPSRILSEVENIFTMIDPDMNTHLTRWDKDYGDWLEEVETLRVFAANRPGIMRSHIQAKFNVSGTNEVTLNVNQPDHGKIKINSLTITDYPWTGTYFKNIPISFTALPSAGYKLNSWVGANATNSSTITLSSQNNIILTAIFEPDVEDYGTVVINEINYNSANNFDPEDWVELYNYSHRDIDISGWHFKDSDESHDFIFPQNTLLSSDGFLILCRDTTAFIQLFPDVEGVLGNMNFGLSGNGEWIYLLNENENFVDSLEYDDQSPWPVAADGNGPTIELTDPALDNTQPQNWHWSRNYGSPGEPNPPFLSPFLVVDPDTLSFVASVGSNTLGEQAFTITDPADGFLNWTARENPDQTWMQLIGTTGGSGDRVFVKIDVTGLSEGIYIGSVEIVDAHAVNSPLDTKIMVQVVGVEPVRYDVVINEINYNSAPDFNSGDWIELYNFSDTAIDISDWHFKDSEETHDFIIPSNTTLHPDGFLILCRDTSAFIQVFPGVECILGNFNFGLSADGEWIGLYNQNGNFIDSLEYDDQSPWPTAADGDGATLELIDPALDNTKPESWQASMDHGSPGEPFIPIQRSYLRVNPDTLHFFALVGATMLDAQAITVTDTMGGPLQWSAQEIPDQTWMGLSNTSGGSGERVSVIVDVTGLNEGTYTGSVQIADTNAVNSPLNVMIILDVVVAPILSATPDSLFFTGIATQDNPPSQEITIFNYGTGTLAWTAREKVNRPWLTLVNTTGISRDSVRVSVDTQGLVSGTYMNVIQISDPVAINSPIEVYVELDVAPRPKSIQITTTSLRHGAVRVLYSDTLRAVGGILPYHWRVIENILPFGLSLDETTGVIQGIPEMEGHFYFRIKVTDTHPYPDEDIQLFSILIESSTDVDTETDGTVDRTMLFQNTPNPFNHATTIHFQIHEPGNVSITIHDILGQRIFDLLDEDRPAGRYTIMWDGRDANGRLQTSGVYFYEMRNKNFRKRLKFLFLK